MLLALLLGGCARLYLWPASGEAFDEGPVVVLGGGTGDRLDLATDLVTDARSSRELVLSAEAATAWEERGGQCGAVGVTCVEPESYNTFGEAGTISLLAAERGWRRVTVITSEFHVTRTRLLFSYCMDVPTAVVASASGASPTARARHLVREPLATVVSLPAYWYCPG